jgi:Protein of unknown function (DUF664)
MSGLSVADALWFVDDCLDEMTAILRQLGDRRANAAPDLPGANAPYAILTHCLGVMEYWGGHMIAGRAITRDRAAEFQARGRVDELLDRTAQARAQLEKDIATLEPLAAPRSVPDPEDADLPIGRTQGGVLLHILRELAQHLGQLQLSRDVIVSRVGRGW